MAKKNKGRSQEARVELPDGVDLDALFRRASAASGVFVINLNFNTTHNTYYVADHSQNNSVSKKKETRVSRKTEINAHNSVVNYKSHLENVSVVLGQSQSTLDPELVSTIEKFRELLKKVEEKSPEVLDLLASRLAEFVQEASKPKDQRKSRTALLSAEGLVAAAKAVKDSVPDLLGTANSIVEQVSRWGS